MRRWIPHLILALVASGLLTVAFICRSMRYQKAEGLFQQVIKENELERKVAEGWWPLHAYSYCNALLFYGVLIEHEEDGAYFFLRQLRSGNDARIALALSSLQYVYMERRGMYEDHLEERLQRGMDAAHESILAWKDEIAELFTSENLVVREHAVGLLSVTPQDSIAHRLREVADSDRPVEVRANAVGGLVCLHSWCRVPYSRDKTLNRKVAEWIEEYMTHDEPEIRRGAVALLSDSEHHVELLKTLQSDNDIRVRTEAALQLFLYDKGCNLDILLSASESTDFDKSSRFNVAKTLLLKSVVEALPALIQLMNDPEVTKLWGIEKVAYYQEVSDRISWVTGVKYAVPSDDEALEVFAKKLKADALEWWEKHKDEVLKESK